MTMEKTLKITIPVDQNILLSLRKTKEEFEKEVRFIMALNLYKKGKISLGKAAELAGYNRIDFIHKLQLEGEIIFDYSKEEIDEIIKDAEKLRNI